MKGKNVVHSRQSDEWETPQDLFDQLNNEFQFEMDAAATKENAKCRKFWTKEDCAADLLWSRYRIWCNPPYSKWQDFVRRASFSENLTVLLLPSRTDTKAFHEYIWKNPRVEIRFIKGRLKFGGSKNGAPFPSMIVIFRPEQPKGDSGNS